MLLRSSSRPRLRGVGGLAFFQRIDRGLADVPGSGEVRLADAQRNHVAGIEHQFEKFADAGAGDRWMRSEILLFTLGERLSGESEGDFMA